jgi:hypothetical protein
MIRKTFAWFLVAVCLTAGAEAATNNFSSKSRKLNPIAAPEKAPVVGESLVFDVFWMGIHVGTGTLEVKEIVELRGRKAYHVVSVARTNEFLTKLYPIVDEMHSYIDVETMHSLEFRKNVREGKYRADEHIVFDYEKKKGFYESYTNGGTKAVDIEPPVHDFVSAIYWFRLQPIEVGKSVHTRANSEEKNYNIEFRVLERQEKEIKGLGTIDTVKVDPKTELKGILYDRGRAWVYFSTDSRRTPVWIQLKTPFGPVAGVLRTAKEEQPIDTPTGGV